jgi:uncharacterized membrane protein
MAGASGGAPAVASFELLGEISPTAVSADGRVVVGSFGFYGSKPPGQAFRWTEQTGVVGLGFLSGGHYAYSTAAATNRDGSVVVGASMFNPPGTSYGYSQGYRVVVPGALLSLGAPPNTSFNLATGVDATGNVVVGYGQSNGSITPNAYRWTESSGLEMLGEFAVQGISADARVVVGYTISTAYQHPEAAVRWTAAEGMVSLGVKGAYTEAHATNADGSVIVGERWDVTPWTATASVGFRWTKASGALDLAALPVGPFCQADALSADGSITVGECGESSDFYSGNKQAAIWDEAHGARALADVLAAAGADLGGISLRFATGVSANGKVFVGTGVDANGTAQGWVARLP